MSRALLYPISLILPLSLLKPFQLPRDSHKTKDRERGVLTLKIIFFLIFYNLFGLRESSNGVELVENIYSTCSLFSQSKQTLNFH